MVDVMFVCYMKAPDNITNYCAHAWIHIWLQFD